METKSENQTQEVKTAGSTALQAKERLGEILFALASFFGLLHFISIAGQVVVMYMHTALQMEFNFPLKSSMLMGNIYLGFLTAYVGRKEYVRWSSAPDNEMLSSYVLLKLTRGEVIIVAWGILTGITAFIWQMGFINEVPETLVWTLGEVVAVWCGTSVLKFFKGQSAVSAKETKAAAENFGDRIVDYCRQKGSIDRLECQNEYGLSEDQAYRLLKKLVSDKKLIEFGDNKGRRYKLA